MKWEFVLKAEIAAVLVAVAVFGCSVEKDAPLALVGLGRAATVQLDYVGDWNYVTPARWASIKPMIRDWGGRFVVYTRPIDASVVYNPPNSADWLARASKVCETRQALLAFGDEAILRGDSVRGSAEKIRAVACAVTGMSASYIGAKMYSIPVGQELIADKEYAEECGLPTAPDGFYVRSGTMRTWYSADTPLETVISSLRR